ncbi:CLUMA_CG014069, isoform A [Clunio marinus]|uniref:CLUMA_CG014069, isoform A n=1 Tax=Clunio marinus TaxID=568069 RepID=A0A1J1IM46_9DIPT|nr:CLUMA_CG014069, isoform A [Clunio marinus]
MKSQLYIFVFICTCNRILRPTMIFQNKKLLPPSILNTIMANGSFMRHSFDAEMCHYPMN